MKFDSSKLIEFVINRALKKVYTSLPAVITAVDAPEMKAKAKIIRTNRDEMPLETGWLKIKTLYAGHNRGFCLVPYKGDECVVCFQDKSLNDGFILPMAFNDVDPPPQGHVPLRIGDCLLRHETGAMILMDVDGNIEFWQAVNNNLVMFDGYIRGQVVDGHEFAIQNRFMRNTSERKEEQSWAKLKHGQQFYVVHRKKYIEYNQGNNPYFCPWDKKQEAIDANLDLSLPFASLSDLDMHINLAKIGESDRVKTSASSPAEEAEEPQILIAGGDTFDQDENAEITTAHEMKYINKGDGGAVTLDKISVIAKEREGDKTEWQETYRAIYNPQWAQITVNLQRMVEGQSLIQMRAYAPIPDAGMGEAGFDIIVDAQGARVETIQQIDSQAVNYIRHKDLIEKEIKDTWDEEKDVGLRDKGGKDEY